MNIVDIYNIFISRCCYNVGENQTVCALSLSVPLIFHRLFLPYTFAVFSVFWISPSCCCRKIRSGVVPTIYLLLFSDRAKKPSGIDVSEIGPEFWPKTSGVSNYNTRTKARRPNKLSYWRCDTSEKLSIRKKFWTLTKGNPEEEIIPIYVYIYRYTWNG